MTRRRTKLGRYRRGSVPSEYQAQVLLRVSPEQRERWRAAAEALGVGLSEWLRGVADAATHPPNATGG